MRNYPNNYKGPKAGVSSDEEWLSVRWYDAFGWILYGTWTYSDFDCFCCALERSAENRILESFDKIKPEISKHPTNEQKVEVYEKLLHHIALLFDMGDNRALRPVLEKIVRFSYAHRAGNGELTEDEQNDLVSKNFWNLNDNLTEKSE